MAVGGVATAQKLATAPQQYGYGPLDNKMPEEPKEVNSTGQLLNSIVK